jgi:hypothetical protein
LDGDLRRGESENQALVAPPLDGAGGDAQQARFILHRPLDAECIFVLSVVSGVSVLPYGYDRARYGALVSKQLVAAARAGCTRLRSSESLTNPRADGRACHGMNSFPAVPALQAPLLRRPHAGIAPLTQKADADTG